MSGDQPQRRSGSGRQYRTADDIVRSILDDRPSTSNVSPSGELYRAIERFHGAAGSTPPPDASMPSDPTGDLTRRFSREPRSRNSPNFSWSTQGQLPPLYTPPPPPLPPLRSFRRSSNMPPTSGASGNSRASRYRPSDRYPTDRHRLNLEYHRWEDLESNLEDANSHLRALLDFTNNDPIIPPLSPPLMPAAVHNHDHGEDSRRIKRRKLDTDRLASNFKGFRYGRYGQVEPGPLTMEMVSCDGGIYSEGSLYAAENILKPDDSVYCTKGNRCNIVLRHQGATVFSLKELVIRGPVKNYSSPVKEGMVFISMNNDDLLMRTAQYQIQYVPSRVAARSSFDRESRTLAPIISVRHHEDGTVMSRSQVRQRRLYNIGMDDEDDFGRAQIPSEFTVAPPPFRVTAECSDEENDELPQMRRRRRTPNRIGSLPFESDSSDEWAQGDDSVFEDSMRYAYRRADGTTPRAISLAEAAEASQVATQEAVRAVGGELMAPHAKFYIERGKNKCTIRFEPPVSGRFILLKMWNPQHDPTDNIDIQGVVAKGFAGPRYFPAVELR